MCASTKVPKGAWKWYCIAQKFDEEKFDEGFIEEQL